MTNSLERNKQEWRKILKTFPDRDFLELIRHYLGPISTPFHKPDLIKKFINFLNRDDVINKTAQLLDSQDIFFLSIIDTCNGISFDLLVSMIPNMHPAELNLMIRNLVERMLVWDIISPEPHYKTTPLARNFLQQNLINPASIIGTGNPVVSSDDELHPEPWINDTVLTFSLNILETIPSLYKKDGELRSKTQEVLEQRMPLLFSGDWGIDKKYLLLEVLECLDLISHAKNKTSIHISHWKVMEELPAQQRRDIIIAATALGTEFPLETSLPVLKMFFGYLENQKSYSLEVLSILLFCVSIHCIQNDPDPVPWNYSITIKQMSSAILKLVLAGFLKKTEEWEMYCNPHTYDDSDPGLLINPSGEISLQPHSPMFTDLALCTAGEKLDITASLKLEKDHFLSGLNKGVDGLTLLTELEKRSTHPVPQNILTLIQDWIREYQSLSLHAGIILQASGDTAEIISHTGILKPYILFHPKNDMWVLDPSKESRWRNELSRLGFGNLPDIRGQLTTPAPSSETPVNSEPSFLSALQKDHTPSPPNSSPYPQTFPDPDPVPILKELKQVLDSSGLDQEDYELILERIMRRTVFFPDQIRSGLGHDGNRTASGLDYQGKLLLARAAIDSEIDRLEIREVYKGTSRDVTMIPFSIRKIGQDYVLAGISTDSFLDIDIKLQSIGYMKRIPCSIV